MEELQQLWFSGGKRSNRFQMQQRAEQQLHQFGTWHHRAFCSTSKCPQTNPNQPDANLLWPGMLPKLAQGHPQKGQNHGWGPQIWACGTFKHHNGSVFIVKPSPIVTPMTSPCLDWWVRTALVDKLQKLWFQGGSGQTGSATACGAAAPSIRATAAQVLL